MDLIVRTHHATVPNDFEAHAAKKLERLERLLPKLGDVTIEVEREETRSAADRFTVRIAARAGGAVLRAEERAADPTAALDAAAEALSRQARKQKDRVDARHHPRPPDGAPAKEIVADHLNMPAPDPDDAG